MSLAERSLENPLRAGLRVGGATVPAAFVIFGATGDLAQRKLLPAIWTSSLPLQIKATITLQVCQFSFYLLAGTTAASTAAVSRAAAHAARTAATARHRPATRNASASPGRRR